MMGIGSPILVVDLMVDLWSSFLRRGSGRIENSDGQRGAFPDRKASLGRHDGRYECSMLLCICKYATFGSSMCIHDRKQSNPGSSRVLCK